MVSENVEAIIYVLLLNNYVQLGVCTLATNNQHKITLWCMDIFVVCVCVCVWGGGGGGGEGGYCVVIEMLPLAI